MAIQEKPQKPLLRGVLHEAAFFVFLLGGVGLLTLASVTRTQLVLLLVYVMSMLGLFGISALLHRRNWSQVGRQRMRRLDHSMIFVAIAATYTAVAGLVLHGVLEAVVLSLVWTGTLVGIVLRLLWIDAPKPIVAIPYLVVGWMAVIALPQLFSALGVAGFLFLVGGGISYTVGAVVYARRRPDPFPLVFGYHEVFHALVIVGAIAEFVVIAFFAVSSK
ncbi:MAG: hemolysin III family protein [Actinobacteria bacterium]|jgi:hemolysin III|nr:hemolysin III family protein [Actinomycetota bacterium]